MKTKFIINDEIFGYGTLEDSFYEYERFYKHLGFILDKENQDVFIILNDEYNFNVMDRVSLFDSERIVTYKCTDITNQILIYHLEEEKT